MRQVMTVAGLTALTAFIAFWTWLWVKGSIIAAREGRKPGWIQAAWTVGGVAMGLVLSAVTLAIGTLIVMLILGGLSQLSEHSSGCDAWTDQCTEQDDVGDYPLGP
jgi:hypothetical protein